MQGQGYIKSVQSVYNCAKICTFVDDCRFVTYSKSDKKCYLKTSDAVRFCKSYHFVMLIQGSQSNDDFDSAERGCERGQGCVKRNTEYANGYFSNYDLIRGFNFFGLNTLLGGLNGYIPGNFFYHFFDSNEICFVV